MATANSGRGPGGASGAGVGAAGPGGLGAGLGTPRRLRGASGCGTRRGLPGGALGFVPAAGWRRRRGGQPGGSAVTGGCVLCRTAHLGPQRGGGVLGGRGRQSHPQLPSPPGCRGTAPQGEQHRRQPDPQLPEQETSRRSPSLPGWGGGQRGGHAGRWHDARWAGECCVREPWPGQVEAGR